MLVEESVKTTSSVERLAMIKCCSLFDHIYVGEVNYLNFFPSLFMS